MKKYFLRLYHPGDEVKIVRLLQLAFNGWPKFDVYCSPSEHWRWKYLDNPFQLNLVVVCLTGNRIIGVDHTVPFKVKIGEKVFLAGYGADLAFHPDFRMLGISKEMDEASGEPLEKYGVKFVYFITRSPFLIDRFSRVYPSFPHTILHMVRIRDIDKQLKMITVKNASLMKLGFYISKLHNNFLRILRGTKSMDAGINISEISFFSNRIEDFWEKVSKHYKFIVERSQDYLNWRYCDPRGGKFIVRQAMEGENITGYCVLRVNRYREDYPIGFIVDLLTIPERLDVANALVADAVQYFDEHDINLVVAMVAKHHPNERALSRFGFLDIRISLHMFYWVDGLEHEMAALKMISGDNIHFSYGDIDSLPTDMPHANA